MNNLFKPAHYFLLIFVLSAGCNKTEKQPSQSEDSTEKIFELLDANQTGIDFSNDLNEDVNDESKNILSFEYFFSGAGVATGDFNNDGLLDVFFVGNETPNQLYLNKGDLKFENITEKANINTGKKWSTGVTTVDINNDGFLDIYICQSGANNIPWKDKTNLLFINNGDLTFTERAKEYGLDDTNIGTQAVFFDFDLDGDLDCFVLNESIHDIQLQDSNFKKTESEEEIYRASCHLYENNNGKFEDISKSAGILGRSFGLGVSVTDINLDGYPDIYICNDYSVPDKLFINNGNGTFTDKIKEFTNQISFYSMGIDIADINNDGLMDIAVADMASEDHIRSKTLMPSMDTDVFWYYINQLNYHYQYMFNVFQLNNGNNTFSNIANMAGVAKSDWSWATLLADFDNDGYKDYYVTNGYLRYARDNDFKVAMQKARDANGGSIPLNQRQKFYDMMPSIKLPNKMYRNNHNLHFESAEASWGMDQESFSNGAAYADLDNDGDLDIIVNNVAMKAFVYRNNTDKLKANNFITIKLESKFPNSNSKVKLYIGDQIQVNEKMNTRGYLSAVDDRLHFGLGDATLIDKIEVTWPNNQIQTLENIKANQFLTVTYDENKLHSKKEVTQSAIFDEKSSKSMGVGFRHVENQYNDFEKQVLLPQKQSNLGPCISTGDVNSDGLEDFYVGGAAGQPGLMYHQQNDGTFIIDPQNQAWAADKDAEDVASILYDADGDGDNDLYVVSGGSEFDPNSPLLEDRLYINIKDGEFRKVKAGLPGIPASGSCVKAADYDKDGDLDLFVGGKAIPGKYPFASPSLLLEFDNFKYTNKIEKLNLGENSLGMVTDANWFDFNNDGWLDLILVGEWMTPRIFINNQGQFEEKTTETGLDKYSGWWQSVVSCDIDGDGDEDLICGNFGLNTKFKASHKKPFNVYASDFDENGTCDVILSKEYKGKEVPTRGRECSSQQMPFIKDKFKTFNDFANASIIDIIGKEGADNALKLSVTNFASKVFINEGGQFKAIDLPMIVQKSPILAIEVKDYNNDGKLDLLVTGNVFETEVETPRYDAGTGQLLYGNNDGTFKALSPKESGFFTFKNSKGMGTITISGQEFIIVANNNDYLQFFKVQEFNEVQ